MSEAKRWWKCNDPDCPSYGAVVPKVPVGTRHPFIECDEHGTPLQPKQTDECACGHWERNHFGPGGSCQEPFCDCKSFVPLQPAAEPSVGERVVERLEKFADECDVAAEPIGLAFVSEPKAPAEPAIESQQSIDNKEFQKQIFESHQHTKDLSNKLAAEEAANSVVIASMKATIAQLREELARADERIKGYIEWIATAEARARELEQRKAKPK